MREPDLRAPEDLAPDAMVDGGDLDCGSGLLLVIKRAMDGVAPGGMLEIRSTEGSVREDLPAWCRMTRHPYLGWRPGEGTQRFFVRRGEEAAAGAADATAFEQARAHRWQCRVQWAGGLATTVYCRNHSWRIGQPASFDVQDEAPSAVEYVLGALGGCLALGFQVRASRAGVTIEALEIALQGGLDNVLSYLGLEEGGHSGFAAITGTAYVQAAAEEETLQALWAETLARSPVANSLGRPVALAVPLRPIP